MGIGLVDPILPLLRVQLLATAHRLIGDADSPAPVPAERASGRSTEHSTV